jgi:hypothetical protein
MEQMIRSTLCTFTKQTMGRVRRRTDQRVNFEKYKKTGFPGMPVRPTRTEADEKPGSSKVEFAGRPGEQRFAAEHCRDCF